MRCEAATSSCVPLNALNTSFIADKPSLIMFLVIDCEASCEQSSPPIATSYCLSAVRDCFGGDRGRRSYLTSFRGMK